MNISEFSKRVIKAGSLMILLILLTLLVLKGFKVILLILAGALMAVFFRGIASFFQDKFKLSDSISLLIAVVLVLTLGVGTFYFLSPRVSSQIETLKKELPSAAKQTKEEVESSAVGSWIIEQVKGYQGKYKQDSKKLSSFFSSFFGGLADIYIIFFLGLFFTIQPKQYLDGIVKLVPFPKKDRAREVIEGVAYTLRRWLLGKMFSMLIVGILTGIGLYILGVPLALTLGIFASIVTFIPNFGPIISLIPAFLLAFTQGFDQALYVVVLYMAIQAIESNLLTPLIQRKMISFPMALVLIAQVILGVFTGVLGLILAVPIVAIVVVLIKMLYVEDVLGDSSVEIKQNTN